jgi:hypothetical protein
MIPTGLMYALPASAVIAEQIFMARHGSSSPMHPSATCGTEGAPDEGRADGYLVADSTSIVLESPPL